MAILVDEARWEWRGLRWAHLASDESYDELHDFAARLGLRRISFQGDHYDVPAELRALAVARGAHAVGSRELVARLRDAGLRTRTPTTPWTRVWQRAAPSEFALDAAAEAIHALGLRDHGAAAWIRELGAAQPALADQGAMALVRGLERALTVDLSPVPMLDLTVGGDPLLIHRTPRSNSLGLEVVWRL